MNFRNHRNSTIKKYQIYSYIQTLKILMEIKIMYIILIIHLIQQ